MKKSELKNGMVVELRNGNRYLILNGNLVDKNFNLSLNLDFYMNDTMKVNESKIYAILNKEVDYSKLDINKVFSDYTSLLMKGLESVVWEREEIDWSKVPIGTKILFSINGEEYTEGLFIKKDGNKFIVCVDMENRLFSSCNYCKLAEESKEKVSYKELLDEFNNYCDKYYNKNNSCVGCECYDGTNICRKEKIIDNRFTIIRK